MEIIIDFPGKARVDAHFGSFHVRTDQPPQATAPTPFALFLASIGTCAGIYVLGFCQQRNLPTEGIKLVQRVESNRMTGMVNNIELEIQLPNGFPEKYRTSLVRAAELCAVKKQPEQPLNIQVVVNTTTTPTK